MNLSTWAEGIPRLDAADSTLDLMAAPYRFIGDHAARLGSDLFQCRLLGQPTLCATGADMAARFYDTAQVERHDAAPEALQATLFGKGAVQGLDGAAHRRRKAIFVQVLAPDCVETLVRMVRDEWRRALVLWPALGTFSLYRALQPVLTCAVCGWAGVPLPKDEVGTRCSQLVALFDRAAGGPVDHLQSRLARKQAEHWLAGWVREARAGRAASPRTALAIVAAHRDEEDELLPEHVAAVELLNVLRPVVAASVSMTFVAHALESNPEWRAPLREAPEGVQALGFVQEVRRHYPFFPALVGRTRDGFAPGSGVPAGMRVLLDIHGTHHDTRWWADPQRFDPRRWSGRPWPPPFAFIPQGGADVQQHHRCPGEDTVVRLMLLTLAMLLGAMRYAVPPQRLALDEKRLPAMPPDEFQIRGVRLG